MNFFRAALSFCLIVLSSPAWANDSEFGSTSGMLHPVKNDHITMVSEDIGAQQTTEGWDLRAIYKFKNKSSKPQKLTIGFPEKQGSDETEFLKFVTKVRGKKVKTRVQKNTPKTKEISNLGRTHLFEVTFAPSETLEIEHQYKMTSSSSVAYAYEEFFYYVTKTGALWNGPIGRATFTIRTRKNYELVAAPPTYKLKSLKRFLRAPTGDDRVGMELVFEMKNWTPKSDLDLVLWEDMDDTIRFQTIGKCPRSEITGSYKEWGSADFAAKKAMYKIDALDKFSTKQLRKCRNWVYAQYGYIFKDKKLQKLFYPKPKVEKYPPIKLMEDEDKYMVKMYKLAPNPEYSPKMLNADDLLYVDALKAEETRRKRNRKKK